MNNMKLGNSLNVLEKY